MDDKEIRRVRATLAVVERGRGRRFSPEVRGMIARAAAKLRGRGESWLRIGRTLGVPPETARRLCLAAGDAGETRRAGFLAVAVADGTVARDPEEVGARRARLVLVCPDGHRVEGLTATEAADLLRRLR